ncbi:unnamed protein product [Parajaminaea phylloscopi]
MHCSGKDLQELPAGPCTYVIVTDRQQSARYLVGLYSGKTGRCLRKRMNSHRMSFARHQWAAISKHIEGDELDIENGSDEEDSFSNGTSLTLYGGPGDTVRHAWVVPMVQLQQFGDAFAGLAADEVVNVMGTFCEAAVVAMWDLYRKESTYKAARRRTGLPDFDWQGSKGDSALAGDFNRVVNASSCQGWPQDI